MAAIAPDLPRRGTRRRCAAISLLLSLAAAPLTAQSARLVAMNIARPYVEDEPPFVPGTVSVPGNVAVPDNLRPTIASMLRYSSTFRRQCARLARASDLDVTVQRVLLPESATGATRRIKFDRNKNVDDDLTFWSRFLSEGAPTINIGHNHVHDLILDGSFLTVEVVEEGPAADRKPATNPAVVAGPSA